MLRIRSLRTLKYREPSKRLSLVYFIIMKIDVEGISATYNGDPPVFPEGVARTQPHRRVLRTIHR